VGRKKDVLIWLRVPWFSEVKVGVRLLVSFDLINLFPQLKFVPIIDGLGRSIRHICDSLK